LEIGGSSSILGGSFGGAFGDDDVGGAEEAIVELVSFAMDFEDVAFGSFVVMKVGDGFVEVGVEGVAVAGDFGDALSGEEVVELFEDHFHALEDGGVFGFGAGGFEAEVEVIEDGKEVLDEFGVPEFDGVGFLAGHAFAVVIEVGLTAEGEIFPLGDIGFEFGDGIGFFVGGFIDEGIGGLFGLICEGDIVDGF
jgi:hypothetical protein